MNVYNGAGAFAVCGAAEALAEVNRLFCLFCREKAGPYRALFAEGVGQSSFSLDSARRFIFCFSRTMYIALCAFKYQ